MSDRSSRPKRSPLALRQEWVELILMLRRTRMSGPAIAARLQLPRATVARVLKRDLPFPMSDEDMAVVREIREQYEYYEHMVAGTPHGEIVPDSLVEKFAVAGTPIEAREQLQRLAATGLVDEIAIIPHAHDPADRERTIRTVGEILRDL